MRRLSESSNRARYAPFDVVVLPYPYADRLAEKRRPAVIISSSKLAPYGLVWVSMITSAENERWPSDIPIPDLDRAGLPAPSVIRPAKVACIESARVDRRLGSIDKPTARALLQRLRAFLGGP
jgi:mRNA interferase MazF